MEEGKTTAVQTGNRVTDFSLGVFGTSKSEAKRS